ncbi:TIGR03936 family radical SAM-associated protein [Massilioclostridium coli]|uniref:TIGR03936 family radical SAM-associated protein n=1 Tax=Massilioclostridium coli TaxID=1870991 RepID=UPI000B11FA00|nr:TIGR03936 family radical SAM-associated protein [Massilioclostridium coli]
MNDFKDIRVFYKKTGRLKYISHLDINRCMQRALKRAGLPVWYTQGFNTHIYLTFALPLSLGYESNYEVMDFRLIEEVSFEEVKQRMNEALPEGLEVFRVAEKRDKVDTIAAACYQIRLYGDDLQELETSWTDFLSEPWIEVEKKTKKGMKRIDIKPELLESQYQLDGDCLLWKVKLPAGANNINPSLYLDEFCKTYPNIMTHCDVLRTDILRSDGKRFE